MELNKKVLDKYEVRALMAIYFMEVGMVLLADAVANDVEDSQSQYHKYMRNVVRPQEDIVETLKDWAEDVGVNITQYLPMDMVNKIDDKHKKETGVGLKEIFDVKQKWATSIALQAIGHGVSATDDPQFEEWYKKKTGKDYNWRGSFLAEPYDRAHALLNALDEAETAA